MPKDEHVNKICEQLQKIYSDDDYATLPIDHVIFMLNVIEAAKAVDDDRTIGIQYTDDTYGEAARKFPVPQRVYPGDAGIDLPIVLSEEEREHGKIIWPGEREMLHTGMIMDFPPGWHGRIIHRSSTEKRYRLRVVEGTIDDYRGELLVQVHNGNECRIEVQHGQRLGQLILLPSSVFKCEVRPLRPSPRGSNGFGSSGKAETE